MKPITGLVCGAMAAAGLLGIAALNPSLPDAAWAQTKQPAAPIKVSVRRITETQYRHAIADVFDKDIAINARFEPEKREDGLLALGAQQLSLTSSGFEQYFAMASSISDQVMDEKRRDALVGCMPVNAAKADPGCARKFIVTAGEQLFRRPMTAAEIDSRLKIANAGAEKAGNFYGGLKLALTSLLMSPEFLFRVETAEPDPANPKGYRLDAYSKASRLSYLLWDAAPDADLRAAARSGAIHSPDVLKQQLTRMTQSPRFEDGARAFFIDMLQLDGFDNLIKDPAAYPKFNQSVSDGAKEQTLKTTIDLLVTQKRDYRDLFTSNETFMNRYLASVYKVPYASSEAWSRYTFPASAERSGILTQVSFLSLFAHPAASSPTRRGVKLHEIFMCEPTPEPPADVDFSKVQAMANGTVRTRLLDHMENTGCTACHRRSDPPGLALEHFDGLGQLRKLENGQLIDVTAELNGKKFDGAQGLGSLLHEDPRIPACLVRNVYAYGVGRTPDERDEDYLADQSAAFAAKGYRLPDLMIQIVSSPEFFKASIPSGARPTASSSSAQPQ
ncbi:MAG TPA: DUF1592 domain-containing protein [Hyphomonadaceae bacterium]|nr:DUF1592 domain-containing protein [Hyphomonadaceae bacterium]